MSFEKPNPVPDRRVAFSAVALATASAAMTVPIAAPAAEANAALETPSSMVGALHTAFGYHHVRAVHAKGIILQGSFRPTDAAKELSQAKVFASGTLPVTVRFSDFTGIPDIPDTAGGANPRGFALKLRLPDGSSLDIVTHSFNGFPTRTSDEFAQLLRAIGTSGADATKPTDLDRFLAGHPTAKTFLATQKPPPVSYGTSSYFGVNAFAFVDADRTHRNARYRFVPAEGEKYLDAAALATKGPVYLQEEIVGRVGAAPIVFDWYAQIAQVGDAVEDPSIAWPETRELIKLGTVTIDKVEADQAGTGKALLFLPGNLPTGIEAVDPMIAMRNAAYPISFGERQ